MKSGLGVALTGILLAWLVGRLPGARNRRRDGRAVLALTAITLLFFWPVILAGHAFPKGGGDLWGQLYPVWTFIARQVRQGVLPLWDPLLMGGDPILSEAQYGLFNPLNWPLYLLSPPPVALVLWRGMVNLLLAGTGMYLFITRSPGLRLGGLAGLLGAVAYMFSDPFIVHLGHPQLNDAMAWLPWSLLALDWALAVPRARQAALAGLPLALMTLAGHGQTTLYGLLALGLYGLWQTLARARQGDSLPRSLTRLALMGVVGFCLAAPMLLPAMERMPWTVRSLIPVEERHGYEFFPALLADNLAPHIHGRGSDGWWSSQDRVESGYVGAVTLFLSGLGLLAVRPGSRSSVRPGSRRAAFWVLLGGLALIFALGYQAPLYPAVARWPFFTYLWKTARIIFLSAFALAVLGALGLQALLDGRQMRLLRGWRLCLLLGALALALAAPRLLHSLPPGPPYQRALNNLRFAALLAVGLAALAWAWRRWRARWAPAALVLLLALELVLLGAQAETDPSQPLSGPEHAAALDFLRGDTGWFRVDSQGAARHLWSPETLQVQGFETLQGSGNPLSLWPFEQFYWSQPSKDAPGYRLLGAKFIVAPKGALPGGEGIWPVFLDDPLVDIHLNTLSLPRAWLVYQTQVVQDYGEARRFIQDPGFEPGVTATVENGPLLDGQGSGHIEVTHYGPNEARFVVRTDAPALLVLSDVFYPGWQGYLDGDEATIYRADATFRGVLVPPGTHQVRMRFFPRSFQAGLGLAVLGLCLLAFSQVRRTYNLQRRKNHPELVEG